MIAMDSFEWWAGLVFVLAIIGIVQFVQHREALLDLAAWLLVVAEGIGKLILAVGGGLVVILAFLWVLTHPEELSAFVAQWSGN